MPRRILLPLLVLLGAGCPPDDGSVPPTFPGLLPSPSPTEVDAPTPGTAEDADRPVDAGTPVPSAADPGAGGTSPSETFRACIILPSSGPAADVGAEMRRGMAIAMDEIAAEKGRTRAIQWVERDTKSTEPGAVAAYHSCFNEGINLVIGPVHPAAVTALVPVAAAHDAVLVVPEIGAALPAEWAPNLFAIAPAATEMGRIAAENARVERGFTKAGILSIDSIFGESLADAFEARFEQGGGGSVVLRQKLSIDRPQDWGKAARSAVADKGAEALFVVGPAPPAEAVARELATPELLAAHAWFVDWSMHPPVLSAGGAAVPRMHWVNRPLPVGPFTDVYEARYQAQPEFPAGTGYDAVLLAARAVEGAPSVWFEDIAKVMSNEKGLPSAFGRGAIIEDAGLRYEEIAGYRLVEPEQADDGQGWVFGGY